jgi:serine/threonine protein kinase
MLFTEGELLKSLAHRNIVKVLNFFVFPNMDTAVVMEYLNGGELAKYLYDRGRLSEEEAKIFFE